MKDSLTFGLPRTVVGGAFGSRSVGGASQVAEFVKTKKIDLGAVNTMDNSVSNKNL